ncbi:MAG: AraC family transcriptional regulator ligand-binding domain-containing protein [Myxococcales bacterium]|nr:AraC family transcriptional regulator ligand-binding domain-containing protein [Myxococcales bacterium]
MTTPSSSTRGVGGVAVRFVRPFLALNKYTGGSVPRDAFERAGLDARTLDDGSARVPWATIDRLWDLLPSYDAKRAIAPVAALFLVDDSLDVPEYVVRHQATVAEGFDALMRYMPLIADGARWQSLPEPGQLRITFSAEGLCQHPHAVAAYALACMTRLAARFTGERVAPLGAEFAFPRPPTTEHYERVFKCALRFDAADNALTVPRDTMNTPMLHGDTALSRTLERMVERQLQDEAQAPTARERVQGLIVELLPRGECSAITVADRLQTPVRTLRRHLKTEGTTFRELVDETRRGLAARYLQDEARAVSEIAYLLGFSTVQAFDRAFRRWYGQTPLEWRRART